MQYYGNLALRPERKPEQQQAPVRKQAQQPSKAVRRRTLPIGEKLLYLFTIAVVVLVACFIIFRYAQIYQVNGQIQSTTKQYNQATDEKKELQRQVEKLSDPKRITEMATEWGMVPLEDRGITIKSLDNHNAVAMKP